MEKIAFITGAASGIGEAMAKNFLHQNYQIALMDLQFDSSKNKYDLTKKKQRASF